MPGSCSGQESRKITHAYLNAEMYINQFYDPANAILDQNLAGFLFEQEYLWKQDRVPVNNYIEELVDKLSRQI